MVFSGDVAIPVTCLRVDRSTFFSRPTNHNKLSTFPRVKTIMGFSVNTTRPLPIKPVKRKGFQRKKGINEVMETIPQATVAPAPVGTKAKHVDLRGAVSQRECDPRPLVSSSSGTLNPGSGYGLERSNAGGKEKSPGLGSDQLYHKFPYNENPPQKKVLLGEEREKNTAVQEELARENYLAQQQSKLPQGPMELPFRFSLRDRRPKIQLTIPRTHSQTYAVVPQVGDKERQLERNQDTPKTVSPPSATTRQRIDSEGPPARLSIVSPISVMQMPTPRRPFSTFSFEEMSFDMPDSTPLLLKSANSDSSDDTGENDDRSSNYSPRSSVSSLTSDPGVTKPSKVKAPRLAFSVLSPTAAGVFDSSRVSAFPKPPRAMKSSVSMIDWADRNKPLPPEPFPEAVKPLKVSASFSRTSSMKARGRTPTPLATSRQSTINIPVHRASLRSKYTPADLDALDDAFEKTSPHKHLPLVYANPDSPTLSQAELELEAQLCSISEDVPIIPHVVPISQNPLQISRGPMHMEPSRKAPSPPQSQYSGEGLLKSRKKRQKKPSKHVAMQMRPGKVVDGSLRSRISAPVLGSNSKAHRVLGRTCTDDFTRSEVSAEPRWDPSDSPHTSPTMSMDDSDAPESDVSPIIPDAAFEEVRQRLELLSPKDDASQVFLEFHEKFLSGNSFPPSPIQEQRSSRPLPESYEPIKSPAVNTQIESTPIQNGQHPPIEIPSAPEPKGSQALECHGHVDERSIRSLGSITASEIPDIYASLPSPRSTVRQSLTGDTLPEEVLTEEEVERIISADAAEKVLLRILENLDNLQDLFATATVSRGFYRTFKRHELALMKNALHGMSSAAWELREMTPHLGFGATTSDSPKLAYTPTLYLKHYMTDMYTMIALKSVILDHCKSFLRADTITALAGGETERASQVDDAFWRVWTFCRIFGCGTNREDDIIGQMDWLRGGILAKQQRRNRSTIEIGMDIDTNSAIFNAPTCFGQGNSGGLSAEDLYDMTEIWTCLGVLVRGFQGKRQLARDFGVFDNSNIAIGDVEREDAEIEEWTYHLLTLGPPTVLDVTSPNSPTATTFTHARSRGYTSWSPPSLGASRSTFLKEAISRVYHEKMLLRHPTIQIVTSYEPDSGSTSIPPDNILASRQRMAAHAQEIKAKRNDPAFKTVLYSEERPMSNFPDVLSKLENAPSIREKPSTVALSTLTPSVYQHTSRSTTPSSILTDSQIQHWPSTPEKQFMSSTNVPLGPQVRDPVDVAVERLIRMGFDEKKAKKALAETDSGNCIDFDKAVEVLVRERKRDVSNLMNWNYRGAIGGDDQNANSSPSTTTSNPHFGFGTGGSERYA